MTRHILYLSGKEIALYAASRGTAALQGRFSPDPGGLDELRQSLSALRCESVAILTDLIEEEFREETLPHTHGRDRRALLARHAAKLYRATPFRQSTVVGRDRQGRRDDRVVFSALTNPDNLEPVLEVIDELGIPLSGIQSLPICTQALLKPLGAPANNTLIVSEQPGGGLRETFIHKGKVRFSRLAPVTDNSPEEYCRALLDEIEKTRRYLFTLRLLSREEPLAVYALTDASRAEAMERWCPDSDTLHFRPVILSHIAGLAGYRNYPDCRFGEALFVHLVNKQRCPNHYARSTHLRRFRTWQMRLASYAAMWLVVTGSLVLSGMNMVDARLMQEDAVMVRQATALVAERYHQVTRQLPAEFADARAMREAINIADSIESGQINIGDFLAKLGEGFSSQPSVVMQDMHWFSSELPDSDQAANALQDDPQDDPHGGQSLGRKRYVISNITGYLPQFDGSYSKAHQQIEQLASWFRQQPGVRSAQVVKKPLNTRTDTEIQGGMGNGAKPEVARFKLRLVMETDNGQV